MFPAASRVTPVSGQMPTSPGPPKLCTIVRTQTPLAFRDSLKTVPQLTFSQPLGSCAPPSLVVPYRSPEESKTREAQDCQPSVLYGLKLCITCSVCAEAAPKRLSSKIIRFILTLLQRASFHSEDQTRSSVAFRDVTPERMRSHCLFPLSTGVKSRLHSKSP